MSDEFSSATGEAQRETERIIRDAERIAMRLMLVGSHFVLRHVRRPHYESDAEEYMAEQAERVTVSSKEDFSHHENLKAVAISKEENEELLKEVPHYDIGDIAIIPRYEVDDEVGYIPTRETAAEYQMTPNELLETAVRNVDPDEYNVQNLGCVLQSLGVDVDPEDTRAQLYVCTTPGDYLGAAGTFVSKDVRKKIYDEIGGDYYVLPSSIHEVLCVPATADSVSPWELENLVRTVNQEVVAPEDRLSNQIFKVDHTLKIKPALTQKKELNPLEILRQTIRV